MFNQSVKLIFSVLAMLMMMLSWTCDVNAGEATTDLISFKASDRHDTTWIDFGSLHMDQVKRNEFVLSGSCKINVDLTDAQSMTLQIMKIDDNTKKPGPIVFVTSNPFCKFLKENEDKYKNVVKYSNFPEEPSCPFPKNEYTFDDYVLEANFVPDDAPKGDYLLVATIKDGEKAVAAFEIKFTVS